MARLNLGRDGTRNVVRNTVEGRMEEEHNL